MCRKKVSKFVAGDGYPSRVGLRRVVFGFDSCSGEETGDGGSAQKRRLVRRTQRGALWEFLRFSEVENTGTTFCFEANVAEEKSGGEAGLFMMRRRSLGFSRVGTVAFEMCVFGAP